MMTNNLAGVPGVDRLLQSTYAKQLINLYGRPQVVQKIRLVLDELRDEIRTGKVTPKEEEIMERVSNSLSTLDQKVVRTVINASGVILHTNLGRAPLSNDAIKSIQACAQNYTDLEYDLKQGKRRNRVSRIEDLLVELLGVESALVVNNNAAAVLLVLQALANRRRVIIPRNQLIEIGGGFRIPDILVLSGAKLMEIGTTNQVHSSDYVEAIENGGSLILHAHASNFKIIGFTGEPSLKEICQIAHSRNIPVLADLGSGAVVNTEKYGLAHEPTAQDALSDGVDVMCFSGDKLLGGPQAGIIAGRREFLEKIKKHPLARVVRADKFLISGLEATVLSYMKNRSEKDIPVWKMISADLEGLHTRVEQWRNRLGKGTVIKNQSTVGGGSLPGEVLPTWILALESQNPDEFASLLRKQSPAVIARIQDGRVCFDPRTVFPEQDDLLLSSISSVINETGQVNEK